MTYLKPHSFMGTLVSPSLLLCLVGLLARVEGQSGPGREAGCLSSECGDCANGGPASGTYLGG